MKIRNSIKAISTGLTISILPIAVMAAPPAAFDNYTVNGDGTINSGTAACTASGINEGGFTQEECLIGGKTYIHSILDDTTGFSDESWIEMGSTMGGISDKQSLTETVGTETFTGGSEINTGTFMPMGQMGIMSGNVMIKLGQSVTDSADGFASGFDFKHGMNMVGMDGYNGKFADLTLTNNAGDSTYTSSFKFNSFTNEGVTMGDLAQAAADQGVRVDVSGALSDSGASITQNFTLNERHGKFTVAAGNANHPTASLPWSAGDSIISTMIGQLIGNGATGSSAGAMAFGLRDFANETTLQSAGVDSQVSANPASFYTPAYTNTALPDPFAAF